MQQPKSTLDPSPSSNPLYGYKGSRFLQRSFSLSSSRFIDRTSCERLPVPYFFFLGVVVVDIFDARMLGKPIGKPIIYLSLFFFSSMSSYIYFMHLFSIDGTTRLRLFLLIFEGSDATAR